MHHLMTRDAIRAEVVQKNLTDAQLAALANEVPIREADEVRAIVGMVVESVLTDRYAEQRETWTVEALCNDLVAIPETYPNRDARAQADATDRILMRRFPDVDATNGYDEASGIRFSQHMADTYRRVAALAV